MCFGSNCLLISFVFGYKLFLLVFVFLDDSFIESGSSVFTCKQSMKSKTVISNVCLSYDNRSWLFAFGWQLVRIYLKMGGSHYNRIK